MKYVVIRTGEQTYPVIFPNHFVHEDVSNAICAMIRAQWPDREPPEPIAAGDATISEVGCAGRSTTLEMESRGRPDELLITMGEYSGYWSL